MDAKVIYVVSDSTGETAERVTRATLLQFPEENVRLKIERRVRDRRGLTAILQGLPAGLEVDTDFIQRELSRRQHGFGRGGRQRIEKDEVEAT